MDGTFDMKLTGFELENIRLALVKRSYSIETYLVRSKDLNNEATLQRDVHVARELIKKIEEIQKNGSRTWSV